MGVSTSRRHSLDTVKKVFEQNGCVLVSTEYINNSTKLEYICKCGNHHMARLDVFNRSPQCPECGLKNRIDPKKYTFEFVKRFFDEKGCMLLTPSEQYKNTNQKLEYICVCGETRIITFQSFKEGKRCFECGVKKNTKRMRHSIEYVRSVFESNGCTLLSNDYKNASQILNFICNCGNSGNVRLHDFIAGNRCKVCVNKKRSISKIGVKRPDITRENHPQWDASKTIEEREKGRFLTEYKQWRSEVYRRDKFTCQCCGDNKGGNLNAHHLDGWDWCKESRFDLKNGITLCDVCHDDFHGLYGFGGNTKSQWKEYMRNLYKENPVYKLI